MNKLGAEVVLLTYYCIVYTICVEILLLILVIFIQHFPGIRCVTEFQVT